MAKQSKSAVKKASSKKSLRSNASSSQGKLQGQTVAFVGGFGHKDYERRFYETLAISLGAKIVKSSVKHIDYIFFGEGRHGKQPAEVAKIQKQQPSVTALDETAFAQFLLPDRNDVLREIAKGKRMNGDDYWESLEWLMGKHNLTMSLEESELENAELCGARLSYCSLTASNLRRAMAARADFDTLERVNLGNVDAPQSIFRDLHECDFSEANLNQAVFFYDSARFINAWKPRPAEVNQCIFTAAKLTKLKANEGIFSDCSFQKANLSDAEIHKSKFKQCDFSKANLSRVHASECDFSSAKLTDAILEQGAFPNVSFVQADLRNANFRGAVLSGADFQGAKLAGSDFQGALICNTKFDNKAFDQANNLSRPQQRQAGPYLMKLLKHVAQSKHFYTKCTYDISKEEYVDFTLESRKSPRAVSADVCLHRSCNRIHYTLDFSSFEEGMLKLTSNFQNGKLRYESVFADEWQHKDQRKLMELEFAAWAESFGEEIQEPAQLEKEIAAREAKIQEEKDDRLRNVIKLGAKYWTTLNYEQRSQLNFKGVDFSNVQLDGIQIKRRTLHGTTFTNASMVEASLENSDCQNVDFSKANLKKASFKSAVLAGAKFHDADLSEAVFLFARLQGADFTRAIFGKNNFNKAQFDHTTIWPAGFMPPPEMSWKGKGPRPIKKITADKIGSLDFEKFLKDLSVTIDRKRMEKAGAMLKAESFQLYAEVKDTGLAGIVKSQFSDDLVYSCRLTSEGAYGCCTQNLHPCGGLRGSLCKHLLVLIVGLAKAGKLDPATVNLWIELSSSLKPKIDEEAMSMTLIRYKGAESGEIDWRPTETIPEDFYAM